MSRAVFISYSRTDLAFARTLRGDLQSAGIAIWIDHERLKPGTSDWEQAVREGILASRGVIYIASPDGRASPYVRDELRIAADYSITVYPIWARGERLSDCMPLGWGNVQHIDVRGDKYRGGVQQLVQQIAVEGDMRLPMVSRLEATTITNVASHSAGVVLRNASGRDYVRNFAISQSPLPISETLTFATETPNQVRLDLMVMENESRDEIVPDVASCKRLCTAILELPPGLPAGVRIAITFDVNEQGLLAITARELMTGQKVKATIQT